MAKPVRTVTKQSKKAESVREVNQQDIEVRAYYIALERETAGQPADPLQDWLTAERFAIND